MAIFKPKVVKHSYLNRVELIITKDLFSLTIHYNNVLIGKRYLDFLWTLLPSQVYPNKFSSYDDRVIKQIVNEVFDGAL